MHAIADALNDPEWARMLPALLMLKNHEAGIKAIDERLEHEQDMVLTTLLERAADEGVLPADLDVPEAITPCRPAAVRPPHRSVALDDGFADRTVDRFLKAYAPVALPPSEW